MKHVEAERQSTLLAAIFARNAVDQVAGFGSASVPFARRLGADRVHARASAARTLASTFPTVQAMLGKANFQALAHGHLLEQPQREGDLGEWGADLPGFIATQADLQAWPYLADCARLADTDTARLYLAFMPGTALITSNWPLHLIHQAHALPEGDAREALFAQVRNAIATPQANTVLVARDGWRAVVSARFLLTKWRGHSSFWRVRRLTWRRPTPARPSTSAHGWRMQSQQAACKEFACAATEAARLFDTLALPGARPWSASPSRNSKHLT